MKIVMVKHVNRKEKREHTVHTKKDTIDIPMLILCAKKVKEQICEEEVPESCTLNDIGSNDEDLVVENLMDGIAFLGEKQLESTHFLSSSFKELVKGDNCMASPNNVLVKLKLFEKGIRDIRSHIASLDKQFVRKYFYSLGTSLSIFFASVQPNSTLGVFG